MSTIATLDAPEVCRLASIIALPFGESRERRWAIDDSIFSNAQHKQIHMRSFTFRLTVRSFVFHHAEMIFLRETSLKLVGHVIAIGCHEQNGGFDPFDFLFGLFENVLFGWIADVLCQRDTTLQVMTQTLRRSKEIRSRSHMSARSFLEEIFHSYSEEICNHLQSRLHFGCEEPIDFQEIFDVVSRSFQLSSEYSPNRRDTWQVEYLAPQLETFESIDEESQVGREHFPGNKPGGPLNAKTGYSAGGYLKIHQ